MLHSSPANPPSSPPSRIFALLSRRSLLPRAPLVGRMARNGENWSLEDLDFEALERILPVVHLPPSMPDLPSPIVLVGVAAEFELLLSLFFFGMFPYPCHNLSHIDWPPSYCPSITSQGRGRGGLEGHPWNSSVQLDECGLRRIQQSYPWQASLILFLQVLERDCSFHTQQFSPSSPSPKQLQVLSLS
jgi:hypothetical protein